MNHRSLAAVHMATFVALLFGATAILADGVSSVRYRGTTFALPRTFVDERAYKDEPNNLRPNDFATIERLVREAPFGPTFKNTDEVAKALASITFPGYGSFYANQLPRSPDNLELLYIEIPQRRLNRHFVLQRLADSSLKVVADFVARDEPEIVRVRASSTGFVYFGNDGKQLVPKRAP